VQISTETPTQTDTSATFPHTCSNTTCPQGHTMRMSIVSDADCRQCGVHLHSWISRGCDECNWILCCACFDKPSPPHPPSDPPTFYAPTPSTDIGQRPHDPRPLDSPPDSPIDTDHYTPTETVDDHTTSPQSSPTISEKPSTPTAPLPPTNTTNNAGALAY